MYLFIYFKIISLQNSYFIAIFCKNKSLTFYHSLYLPLFMLSLSVPFISLHNPHLFPVCVYLHFSPVSFFSFSLCLSFRLCFCINLLHLLVASFHLLSYSPCAIFLRVPPSSSFFSVFLTIYFQAFLPLSSLACTLCLRLSLYLSRFRVQTGTARANYWRVFRRACDTQPAVLSNNAQQKLRCCFPFTRAGRGERCVDSF